MIEYKMTPKKHKIPLNTSEYLHSSMLVGHHYKIMLKFEAASA